MPKWHLKRRNCRRSEIQQIEALAGATRDSDGSSRRHRDLEPVRLLKAMSIARSKAGCARFLTLIHSRRRLRPDAMLIGGRSDFKLTGSS